MDRVFFLVRMWGGAGRGGDPDFFSFSLVPLGVDMKNNK